VREHDHRLDVRREVVAHVDGAAEQEAHAERVRVERHGVEPKRELLEPAARARDEAPRDDTPERALEHPRNRRITVVIPVEQSESKTEVIGEAAPIPVDSLERSP
jgi:hypothetical protein